MILYLSIYIPLFHKYLSIYLLRDSAIILGNHSLERETKIQTTLSSHEELHLNFI